MEVIGAGFGRTGTYSTKLALEELGYKCHHMEAVFTHGQAKQWQAISRGIDVEVKLRKIINMMINLYRLLSFAEPPGSFILDF